MKNIKIKYGKTHVGINKEHMMSFKTEAEYLKAMEGKLTNVPEPKRTEILKEEYGKLQPVKAEPAKKG